MGYSRGIQIYDLEVIQSDLEQELTIEDAKKVVCGAEKVVNECFSSNDRKCKIQIGKASIIKIHIPEPKPNPNPPI